MEPCCAGCTCGHRIVLKYGPIGNPDSTDPFERAQARAPEGWHVEGQIVGGRMAATRRDPRAKVEASGPDQLVEAMVAYEPTDC